MDDHNRNTLYVFGLIIAVILFIALLTSGEPEGFRSPLTDFRLHVDDEKAAQVQQDIQRGINAANRASEIEREVHSETDEIRSRMSDLFQ